MSSESAGEEIAGAIAIIMVLAVVFSLIIMPYYLARAFYRKCRVNIWLAFVLYAAWTVIGCEYIIRLAGADIQSLSADYILLVWMVEEPIFLVMLAIAGIMKATRPPRDAQWAEHQEMESILDDIYFVLAALPVFIFASLNLWYPNSGTVWVDALWYISMIWSIIGIIAGTLLMITDHSQPGSGTIATGEAGSLQRKV